MRSIAETDQSVQRVLRKPKVTYFAVIFLLHQMNPLTIRTNPGRTIGNTPLVLGKAGWTDFKTAGTAPAEGKLLFTAVAGVTLLLSTSSSFGFVRCLAHIYVY